MLLARRTSCKGLVAGRGRRRWFASAPPTLFNEYFEAKFGGAALCESIKRTNVRSASIVAVFAGLHLVFHTKWFSFAESTHAALLASEPGTVWNQALQIAISPAWNFLGMASGIVLWYANVKYARSLVSHVIILPTGVVRVRAHDVWGKPSTGEAVHFASEFKRENAVNNKVGEDQSVYLVGQQKFIFNRKERRMEQIFARAASAVAEKQQQKENDGDVQRPPPMQKAAKPVKKWKQ